MASTAEMASEAEPIELEESGKLCCELVRIETASGGFGSNWTCFCQFLGSLLEKKGNLILGIA